jgi:NAD(P)-dependent dehydrogenase (short-subunit alcohol dehydrogenase family)
MNEATQMPTITPHNLEGQRALVTGATSGIGRARTAALDPAEFDKMLASNVRAPFFLVAALAPGMAARGHGSIVSVSSMAGGVGLVGGAA